MSLMTPAAASPRRDAPTDRPLRLLVFERGMFKPRREKPVHGVELGRLLNIRELVRAGIEVSLPVQRDWVRHVRAFCGEWSPRVAALPYAFRRAPTGLLAAGLLALRGSKHDVLLLGDPDNPLLPAIRVLLRAKIAQRIIIAAEGERRDKLIRALRNTPLTVVANSELVARHWRSNPLHDVHVYYGIVDHERFHPPDAPRRSERFDVLLLAKLPSPTKRVNVAIEAHQLLPPELRARVRLHIAGYVRDLPTDLPENVIAYPWMSRERCPGFVREMDAMIVPSRWESFSQSAVQGMLTGLPLVVNDIPPLTEKVDAGGGIVARSPSEFAEALAKLASDRDLRERMGRIARETALDRYTWSASRFIDQFLTPAASPAQD